MSMATKLGRMMNYLEGLLRIKLYDRIITWSCKITWQTNIIINPLTQCLWLSVLAGWRYEPFHEDTRSFYHMVLQGDIKYFSCCITITTMPMATKFGKVVTYYKKIEPIKSYNPLNMWSREVV